ncbi:MAG TPA: LpxD N-terminal domain-containing protein, partial [Gammaproteobacteria bacterium]|nr:LpxD N-terminal domain-containing protein [Gammaproteobacteria bacterium]
MEASAGFTAGELAARFGCELRGDPAARVTGVCTLQHGREGLLSFLANDSYRRYLADTAASVVVVAPRDAGEVAGTALIHADPYLIYARIAALFAPPRAAVRGVDAHATVAAAATVAPSAYVGPHAVIGAGAVVGERVRIGPGCVLAEGVRIEADSELVARVYLGPGVRLGQRV